MERLICSAATVFAIALNTAIYLIAHREKLSIKALRAVSLAGGLAGLGFGWLVAGETDVSALSGCLLSGVLCGQGVLLLCETLKAACSPPKSLFADDGYPPRFYITGDKHRDYQRVACFCREMGTRRKDVLIILGDAGFNYYGDDRDDRLKSEVSRWNITLLCLHGNKENRPGNVGTYGLRSFCGGMVYYEPKYPNIFFAIDGEIYNFGGREYLAVGGAHSVDKQRCLEKGLPYWDDEMPDDTVKAAVEQKLAERGNRIYGLLTHTCPIRYLPTEMFMTTREKSARPKKPKKRTAKPFEPDIDRSTEEWLETIEKKLDYNVWYCGHYHVDKQIDRLTMMHREIRPLEAEGGGHCRP